FIEADPDEGVERERGVPDPGVSIVPVAVAPEPLGKTRRRRGHDRACGRERQQLQHERGAFDHLPPVALVVGSPDPLLPETQRLSEFAAASFQELLAPGPAPRTGQRKNEWNLVSLLEREASRDVSLFGAKVERSQEVDGCGAAAEMVAVV